MTAQYQTLNDNCVQACVASILELPLQRVPHVFEGITPHWSERRRRNAWRRLEKWADGEGYKVIHLDASQDRERLRTVEAGGSYYIGCFYTNSWRTHAVVMRGGRVVFDPEGNGMVGRAFRCVVLEKKRDNSWVWWLIGAGIIYSVLKACFDAVYPLFKSWLGI